MALPELRCSTRPCIPVGVSGVPWRNCSTNAQWGESGAGSAAVGAEGVRSECDVRGVVMLAMGI
jgi:hypothetical protein